MNSQRDKTEAISAINTIQHRLSAIEAYTEHLTTKLGDDSLSWSNILAHVERLYHSLDPAIKEVRTNDR